MEQEFDNIKFKREIVEKLRQNKERTGITITAFAEKAVLEKLERDEKLKKALEV